MSKLRDKLIGGDATKPQTYTLTDWEFNFVTEMNIALRTSIYWKRLMSGIFTYIAKMRVNLQPAPEGFYYKFEIDLEKGSHDLSIILEDEVTSK